MSHWTWHSWNGTPYLTCNLLEPWQHGFFTRQSWPSQPDSLVYAIGQDTSVCRVKQVHGNTVLAGSEMQQYFNPMNTEESPYPKADGLYSDAYGQALWVCSADCTPVLIGDRTTGHAAAVHAGWRGTAARIVPRAVERLLAQGSQLSNLIVAMGPAISGAVYQVDNDVAKQMAQSLIPKVSESAVQESAMQNDIAETNVQSL
ncbi:MAG: peptidoglycan editing factor PgeF, partial [Cyanobacteria bacterium P01_F01_bin.42]